MPNEYTTVISGFEVVLFPSEDYENAYEVILSDQGAQVYQAAIPLPVNDESEEAYSEDLIEYAAKAAVDLYEAERNTLGLGAGAKAMKARNILSNLRRKKAYVSGNWEDWYYRVKGTPYQEQAEQLLQSLIELDNQSTDFNSNINELYSEESRLMTELDQLNFERMKKSDPATITIIMAKKGQSMGLWGAQGIQEYLDKFVGTDMESQALSKIEELIDVRSKITNLSQSNEDSWNERTNIENAMSELMLQSIQSPLEAEPEGPDAWEAAPAMMEDLAELAEGIDLKEPIEPMIAKKSTRIGVDDKIWLVTDPTPDSEFEDILWETDLASLQNYILGSPKNAWVTENTTIYDNEDEAIADAQSRMGRTAQEEEPEVVEVVEIDTHGHLDPAEDPDTMQFDEGDKVKLKNNVTITLWGGVTEKYDKNTSGTIDSLFDEYGFYYLVVTDKGKMIKVKYSDLSKG